MAEPVVCDEETLAAKNSSLFLSLRMKRFWKGKAAKAYQWDFYDEEGREQIHEWSKARIRKLRGINKTYHGFLVYTFSFNTLKSFIQNFNFMVIIQMALAGLSIYIFQYFEIWFDIHVSLFVSPIVFPLAFSINTDFQRREKVLEDLANFKSAGMCWYFCMREWQVPAGLEQDWINAVHSKLKSMLFHLREFLLTYRLERRKVILRAMYEDISDASQLIERVRCGNIPGNPALISRVVHLLQMMSLSFERLRVVREYRSPRSIRAFNKVLILFLPIILGPYFVFNSLDKNGKQIPSWTPYYISILVSFVFSALQGVQDKLDDPFDGMSEDDINLEQIDEWTFHSLEATVNRTYKIGRFQVNVDRAESIKPRAASIIPPNPQSFEQTDSVTDLRRHKSLRKRVSDFMERPGSFKRSQTVRQESTVSAFEPGLHPYADMLEKISGNQRIEKGGAVRPIISEASALDLKTLDSTNDASGMNQTNRSESDGETKKALVLENLFQNPNTETKPKPRTVSFNDNPTVLSPVHSRSRSHDTTPLLPINKHAAANGRFKLSHMERITSSTSTPVDSPKTSTSTSPTVSVSAPPPEHTIVNVVESTSDSSEAMEMDLLSPPDEQDFVVIDNEKRTDGDEKEQDNDVFI